MECNNKYCVWNMFDQCCPDSEERFNEATPNELDCPSSIREDLQAGVYHLYYRILDSIDDMAYDDRLKILIFMLNQRDEGIDLHKELEIVSPGTLIYMYAGRRKLSELLEINKYIDNMYQPIKRPWTVELPDDNENLKSVPGVRPSLSEMTEEDMQKWKSKQK